MIRILVEPAHRGRTAAQRVLLLPPAHSGPEDFLRAGFADAVRERGLDLDLVLIEPALKSVTDRDALAGLREELLAPARAAGCRALWLGGISLGAYIALDCAERHRSEIDGLVLIAPYLGTHIVISEIERAGGLERWHPGVVADDDEERRIWRFIQAHGRSGFPIHLGTGSDDRFAARHRLLAEALAREDVDVVPGGHEWPVWRSLWENFLDARFVAARQ
ncbi:MAG TPA: hypothetical protein VEU54_12140 [Steroidobacteraceae bacterium]|nr:hypothetical protein [Steroidobacteraceae bacterium]